MLESCQAVSSHELIRICVGLWNWARISLKISLTTCSRVRIVREDWRLWAYVVEIVLLLLSGCQSVGTRKVQSAFLGDGVMTKALQSNHWSWSGVALGRASVE